MNTAIILAAGKGSRMKSNTKKQYMNINGKPLVYYSLKAFEQCEEIDDIIIVTGEEDIQYFQTQIIDKYNIKKIRKIVPGGKERYNSVYNGLEAIEKTDYVLIHDGARAFITLEQIKRMVHAVCTYKACVAAVKSKDTVKISDENGYVKDTPSRENVWQVQTPQAFEFVIISDAYRKMMMSGDSDITDDAMVAERYGNCRIKLIEMSYENIKVTTPEDIIIGENIIKSRERLTR